MTSSNPNSSPTTQPTFRPFAAAGRRKGVRLVPTNTIPGDPTEAPAAPSSLTGSTFPTSINLTWTDNSVFPNTAASFTYEWQVQGVWQSATTTATSATITGLAEVTAHPVRVRANNAIGSSAYSAEVSPAITGILAPTNLSVSVTGTTVNVSWTDASLVETEYRVERSSNGGTSYSLVATTAADASSYADTNRPDGTYKYRVAAVRSSSPFGQSEWTTQPGTVTVASVPAAPTGLSVSGVTNTRLDLSWSDIASNETGYVIERRLMPSGSFSQIAAIAANEVSYRDNTIQESRQYEYRVAATNAAGTSAYSNTVSVWTVPNAPTFLEGFGTFTAAYLDWVDNSTGNTGYLIERRVPGGTFAFLANTTNEVTYTNTGLTTGSTFEYRVAATNATQTSAWSNTVSVTMNGGLGFNPGVPAAPSNLVATATGSSTISLSWTDNANNETGFAIERSTDNVNWTVISDDEIGPNGNSYSAVSLNASTLYYFRVKAENEMGWSPYSNTASATTQAGSLSPSWTLDFSTGEPWSNGTNYVFSSTASTTRTFVNSSGYVAPCVANLATHSQDITNAAWSNSGTTDSGDTATAPDGTTTADTLTESPGTSSHFVFVPLFNCTSGTNYTVSMYVKDVNATRCQICTGTGGFGASAAAYPYANFDLTAGTVSATGGTSYVSSAITSVGSGWYRITMTATAQSTTNNVGFALAFINSGTATRLPSYAVSSGSEKSMYVWGAQVVTGSDALPYSATTTSSNGIPRLTHNSSGSRLGLLVEGQVVQRNHSTENFAAGSWFTGTTNISNTTATNDPSNGQAADKIAATTANSFHWVRQSVTGIGTTTVSTASCYVKAGGGVGATYAWIGAEAGGAGKLCRASFDLTNGSRTDLWDDGVSGLTAPATAEDVGNGWYRISITVQGITRVYIGLQSAATATVFAPTFAGAAADGDFIYAWGYQTEIGAGPTSYIPNTATSGTVTRQADIAYVETADVTNWGRPGSFVVEYYKPTEQSGGVVVADDDGAGNAGRLGVEYSAGGPRIVYGTSGSGSGGTDTTGLNKVGWAWDGSGAATRSALNGSALDTSLATSFDPALTDGINLGGNIDWTALPLTVSGQPNVVIRKVRFWNSQLSAADLNTLTT